MFEVYDTDIQKLKNIVVSITDSHPNKTIFFNISSLPPKTIATYDYIQLPSMRNQEPKLQRIWVKMLFRRLRTKLWDLLRQTVNFELSVQEKCTLFVFAIVAVHVGGIVWILITDETKILPQGLHLQVNNRLSKVLIILLKHLVCLKKHPLSCVHPKLHPHYLWLLICARCLANFLACVKP